MFLKIVVEFIEYELFTSFQRYIISILPIHSEYPGSLCIWQVFQIQFPRTTKSPLERKNFISPFFPPFIFAYKITSTSCSKRPSKKSVTENSAKTSSLSSLPPHIIDTPLLFEKSFDQRFLHLLSSSFTVSSGNVRVEGRGGIDPLCAANLNAGVNVSGIRKIGNRFLIPRENSSFTLVSTLDRRRKDQRGGCEMSGDANVLLFRRDWSWWGEFEVSLEIPFSSW